MKSKTKIQLAAFTFFTCTGLRAEYMDKEMDYLVNPAQVKKTMCKIDGPSVVNKIDLSIKPNFFFRYLAGRKMTFFSSSEQQNFALDLKTKKRFSIPGIHDPVPLWGEDVITVPRPLPIGGGGVAMEFYSMDKALAGEVSKALLYVDPTLKGVYQSIGQLGTPDEDGSYVNRVLTDAEGVSFRDYKVVKKDGKVVAIKPLGKVKRICTNFEVKTPMLSKDGTELAGFDAVAGVTKIWKINPNGGACTVVQALQYGTGKVDFSFDSKYLTFHMNSSLENYSGTRSFFGRPIYTGTPTRSQTTNVFVLERKTGELKQITFNSDMNSYYPVWGKDGLVTYISYGGSGRMSFNQADPQISGGTNAVSSRSRCALPGKLFCPGFKDYLAESVVGSLWLNLCTSAETVNPQMALLVASNMSKEKCETLVSDLWWGDTRKDIEKLVIKSHRENAKNRNVSFSMRRHYAQIMKSVMRVLTDKNVLAVCADNKSEKVEAPTTGQTPGPVAPPKHKGVAVLEMQCMSCHSDVPFDDMKGLAAKKAHSTTTDEGEEINWAQAAIMRIQGEGGEKMPLGGELTADETAQALDYLKSVK